MIKSKKVNEAFLNEFKGALFEFLVSQAIARHYDLEASFFASLSSSTLHTLGQYELEVRHAPSLLLKNINELVEQTSQHIIDSISFPVRGIELLAKSNESKKSEADLLILGDSDNLGISLKLCKERAAINTKSAGVKSIFKKYFEWSPQSDSYQKEFNSYIRFSFLNMASSLYALYDLDYQDGFCEAWKDAGLPDRPGELDSEANQLVKAHYSRVIQKLKTFFDQLIHEDKELFMRSVVQFLGFSAQELIQFQCLYYSDYKFSRIKMIDYNKLMKLMKDVSLSDYREGKSFFSLLLVDHTLQVRVKPMNKFTVEGMKVNFGLSESTTI